MGSNRYLVKRDEQGWLVEHDGQPLERHDTRDSALREARSRACSEVGEVILLRSDGTVETEEKCGKPERSDPIG